MDNTNSLQVQQSQFELSTVGQATAQFELLQRMAKAYTSSTIVPVTYQGQQNIGNCIIALDIATRLNANPLMVMQNMYVVHGNPTFSSKFLIATINASGRYTPIRYEFKGKENTPEWGCRVFAYEKNDVEHKNPLYGPWVTIAMANGEGWSSKNGSKWKTMPQLMLQYRAAAFWQRLYAPEVSMGLLTQEEAMDIQDVHYEDVTDVPAQQQFNGVVDFDAPAEQPQQQQETEQQQSANNADAPY